MVVRSSAHGDAAGTGFYDSVFYMKTGNKKTDLANLELAIKTVLASEFSQRAYAFRQKRELDHGVAVMIEPAFVRDVTQEVVETNHLRELDKGTYLSPDISGFAYTSTETGRGFAGVVLGLPTSAVAGKGAVITIRHSDNDSLFGRVPWDTLPRFQDLVDQAVVFDTRNGQLSAAGFYTETAHYELDKLFGPLLGLERDIGEPIYAEWALRRIKGQVERAILQISGVSRSDYSVVFPADPKNIFASAEFVLRSGCEDCQGIFFLPDTVSARQLAEFNKTHKGYVLVADYKFFSDVRGQHDYLAPRVNVLRDFHLDYGQFDNTSAILVCGPPEAKNSVKGHFEGALKEAQVVGGFNIGMVDYVRERLASLMGLEREGLDGKNFVNGNIRAIASAKEQKMLLILG